MNDFVPGFFRFSRLARLNEQIVFGFQSPFSQMFTLSETAEIFTEVFGAFLKRYRFHLHTKDKQEK